MHRGHEPERRLAPPDGYGATSGLCDEENGRGKDRCAGDPRRRCDASGSLTGVDCRVVGAVCDPIGDSADGRSLLPGGA